MKNEKWRYFPQDERYEISDLGRVRSAKTKRILRTKINYEGYEEFKYKINRKPTRKRVHRLVALAFLLPPVGDRVLVDHINHLRADNRAGNLRWVNNSENALNRRYDRSAIVQETLYWFAKGYSQEEIVERLRA